MVAEFAPKGVEVLQAEVLEDLGVDYEGNEEMVDKIVDRRKKDEDFKTSVHDQKTKAQATAEKRAELLKKAGFDPETGEKLAGNPVAEIKSEGLSAKDVIALRDIHEEDVDYLLDEAKLRGKTVSDLKKDPYVKAILKIRAEERTTAEVSTTSSSRQRSQPTTSDRVLNDFSSGVLPDTEEGGTALAKAQFEQLLKGTK